jgi:hypothetical protein
VFVFCTALINNLAEMKMRTALPTIACLPILLMLGSESAPVRKGGKKEPADESAKNDEEKRSQDAPTTAQACNTGCSAVTAKNKHLHPSDIRNLLAKFSKEETDKATKTLETLLFHGKQMEDWLDANDSQPLDKEHAAFLKYELKRGQEAHVSARIIDAEDICRMVFEQSVPIGEKQHLHVYKTKAIATPIFSFTVKRVGLHHLWTRL